MRRRTVIILTVACALAIFFLAPVIPVPRTSIRYLACPIGCFVDGAIVSPSFYLFHVGGAILTEEYPGDEYLVWYTPGFTCTPIPEGYTCRLNAVGLWPAHATPIGQENRITPPSLDS